MLWIGSAPWCRLHTAPQGHDHHVRLHASSSRLWVLCMKKKNGSAQPRTTNPGFFNQPTSVEQTVGGIQLYI